MSGEKEIRTKIRSVKNMQKITKAMEMVAAAKIRKAQKQMEASRPYAERIRRVIGHLGAANPEYKHPWLVEREAKRVGYIVISTDRGLCGGLNNNLFRRVMADMMEWQKKGVEATLVTFGKKASAFFKNVNVEIMGHVSGLGEKPQIEDLIGAIRIMIESYRDNAVQRVYIVANEFINTMTQKPVIVQLLPLPPFLG